MKSTSCTPSPVRRRALAVALCALLATASLAGCGQQTEEPQALGTYTVKTSAVPTDQVECSDAALVVTAAQGQAFRVPNNALAFAKAAVEGCGYVSTVDSAGSVDSAVYTATSNSKANKREETDTNTKTVFKDACNLRASKPEVDLLAALNAAASDLQANAVGNRKAICVVASGISTTGLLATTPELLAADAHDVAAQLQFVGDEATFADPEAADELLGSIAEQVREQGYTVEVEGHTAASQLYPDHGMELSTRRAQAVADALTARGIDPAQVAAAGVGDADSTSLASGNFDEAQAAKDRKVVLRLHAA